MSSSNILLHSARANGASIFTNACWAYKHCSNLQDFIQKFQTDAKAL